MIRSLWEENFETWEICCDTFCKSNLSPKLPITIDLLPEALLLQMLRIAKHARTTFNEHLLAKLEYIVFEWDCFRRSGLINDSFGEIVCNSMPTEILSANLNIIPHSMFTMSFTRVSRSTKYFINLHAYHYFKRKTRIKEKHYVCWICDWSVTSVWQHSWYNTITCKRDPYIALLNKSRNLNIWK